MRIAFFTDTYLPNKDGVVVSILNFRKELEKRGHQVFIFCPGTKKQKEENKDPNVYFFTSASFKPYPDYRIALFPFLSAVKRAKELDINIVHSHGIATTGLAAIQCANKLKIPAVASFHTLVPEAVHYITKNKDLQSFFKSVAWKYLCWYYSHFKKVIVPTNHTKAVLESQGIRNLAVLPSGIDLKNFKSDKNGRVRKEYNLKGVPVILHVGRVALEKKLDLLIDAAPTVLNIHPDAVFMIVGKGPAEGHYKSLVDEKKLGNSFIFTGYVPDAELPGYYAAADIFVFPSLFETQGLVVLESLSMGVPVIGRKDSPSSEFIQDGKTGYLFNDSFDLPEKIISALKNKEKLRAAASEGMEKYDVTNTVSELVAIYESMLSSP